MATVFKRCFIRIFPNKYGFFWLTVETKLSVLAVVFFVGFLLCGKTKHKWQQKQCLSGMLTLEPYKQNMQLFTKEFEWTSWVLTSVSLSESEEMKGCICRVRSANTGLGLKRLWHHLLVVLLGDLFFSRTKNSKTHFERRVCSHYRRLILYIVELRMATVVFGGFGTWLEEWIRVSNNVETEVFFHFLESIFLRFRYSLQQQKIYEIPPKRIFLLIQWVQKRVMEKNIV